MSNYTRTVGPGKLSTSLQDAIDDCIALGADLTTDCCGTGSAGILTISIEGDWSAGHDTATVNINGFTTSASYYLVVTTDAANRAGSSWVDTKYVLELANDHCISVQDDYVRINGLQIHLTGADATDEAGIMIASISATNNDVRISNCYIIGCDDDTNHPIGVRQTDPDANFKMWNTIITGFTGTNSYGATVYHVGGSSILYNCLIYNCYRGIRNIGGDNNDVYNTVIFETGDDFYGTWNGTIDHCASDDNDGDNNVDETAGATKTWADSFNNAAGGDFTLKAGAPLLAKTTDKSSGLFTDDINGDTRPSVGDTPWSVGADDTPTVAGSSIPVMMAYYRRLRA